MDNNNCTSFETVHHASNVENLLRLLCIIPNLEILVKIDEEYDYPFEHGEEGQYSKLLLGGHSLTIQLSLDL